MKFTKTNVMSNKLGQEIELESFNKDDMVIISTNSLKKLFESLKTKFGIKDTFTTTIYTNESYGISYITVDWNIKDKDGYDSTFTGEFYMADTKNSVIAKNFPKTTALNRAQSAGIIAYLQLPCKAYSDTQVLDDSNEDSNNNTPNTTESTFSAMPESVEPIKVNTVNQAPSLNDYTMDGDEDTTVESTENVNTDVTEEAPVEKTEEPKAATPYNPSDNEDDDDNFHEEVQRRMVGGMKVSAPEKDVKEEKTHISTQPAKNVDTNSSDVTDETLVGFGVLRTITIGELLKKYKDDDKNAAKYIEMINNNNFSGISRDKIKNIKYIKRRLKEI